MTGWIIAYLVAGLIILVAAINKKPDVKINPLGAVAWVLLYPLWITMHVLFWSKEK